MQLVAMDILGPLPGEINMFLLLGITSPVGWRHTQFQIRRPPRLHQSSLMSSSAVSPSLSSYTQTKAGNLSLRSSGKFASSFRLIKPELPRTTRNLMGLFDSDALYMSHRAVSKLGGATPQANCMAYNSSKPFFLMFGREARLPLDLLYRPDPDCDQPTQHLPHYVQNLRCTLNTAFAQVQRYVGVQQERQQEFYNRVNLTNLAL